MPLIWVNREAEYFCAKGWTEIGDLPVGLNGWPMHATASRLATDRLLVSSRRTHPIFELDSAAS
jgi:hypothetical protein